MYLSSLSLVTLTIERNLAHSCTRKLAFNLQLVDHYFCIKQGMPLY